VKVDPSWFVRHGESVIERHAAGFPADTLKANLRIATRLRAQRSTHEAPLGASRLGGAPDLPSSTEWPRWEGFNEPDRVITGEPAEELRRLFARLGREATENDFRIRRGCAPSPLSFLAQIDLSETPDGTGLLPEHGWLYFFYDARQQPWGYDPRHRGAARVVYIDGTADSLRRAEAPAGAHAFAASAVKSDLVPTLPEWEQQPGLKREQFGMYQSLRQDLSGPAPHHRLLGWPTEVQGEMSLECQLVSHGIYSGSPDGYESDQARDLRAGASDWLMLLQLDTDENGPGWMWGDTGCLYFWIRKQDLAALQFDRIWAILQCC
jgi:uncharacterized protein YwqG